MSTANERWLRIQALFERAVELTPNHRRQFLDSLTGTDAELRGEVTSLLSADTKAEEFIEGAVRESSKLLEERGSDTVPAHFGKYEVLEVVGKGGFGVVYRGRDPALRRFVAIKICSTGDERLRRRFFREAHIVAGLQHPNITTVHDLGVEDGVPFLVQEFLDGEDLLQVIERAEPLVLERRLEILRQIARGLEYAHSRGVLHRDIKPANVRILSDGSAKIMDFGIAKALQEETRLTTEGQAMGTVGYLPPEQLKGEAVDPRSDIFAFGVLAYELLGGRRPFDGKTFSEISYKLLYEAPTPLREVWPECPPHLDALVARCLEKNPDDRYPGAGELLLDLESGATRPLPSPEPEPTRELPRRRTGASWVAAAGVTLLLAAGVVAFVLLGREPGPGEADPEAGTATAETELASVLPATATLAREPGAELGAVPSGGAAPAGTASSPAAVSSLDAGREPGSETIERPRPGSADGNERPAVDAGSGSRPAPPPSGGERTATTDARPRRKPAVGSGSEPVSPLPGAGSASRSEPVPEVVPPPPTREIELEPAPPTQRRPAAGGEADRPAADPGTSSAAPPEPVPPPSPPPREPEESPAASEPAGPAIERGDLIPAGAGVKPELISRPTPTYPARARRRKVEAQVVVAVLVDEDGKVIQALLKHGAEPDLGFNDAALAAARLARFRPPTLDGIAGRMWTELPYEFRVER